MTKKAPSPQPTLARVIQEMLKGAMYGLRVSAPCRVKGIASKDPMQVDVELGYLATFSDGDTLDAPVINSVPVCWPTGNGGKAAIRFPLAKGDTGLLVFNDRSLDQWMKSDGRPTNPKDGRSHDLSDAVFIPGLPTDSGKLAPTPYDNEVMLLNNDKMKVVLHPDGKVEITGGPAELIAVLSDTLANVSALANALVTFAAACTLATIEPALAPAATTLQTSLNSDIIPPLTQDKINLDTMKV